jgi:hypothetical protein
MRQEAAAAQQHVVAHDAHTEQNVIAGGGCKRAARTAVPYRKLYPSSEQTANRVMLLPDDRFFHVAGMCGDQAIAVEGAA